VRAKPNVIEVQLRSAAKAEMTGDAIVKYRDAKRRTLEAFAALKMGNVEIEELGLSIAPGNSAEMMQNMIAECPSAGKTQIELASTLLVRRGSRPCPEMTAVGASTGRRIQRQLGPSPEKPTWPIVTAAWCKGLRSIRADPTSQDPRTGAEKAVADARAQPRDGLLNDAIGKCARCKNSGLGRRTADGHAAWEVARRRQPQASQISSELVGDIPSRQAAGRLASSRPTEIGQRGSSAKRRAGYPDTLVPDA
jgi:hypothetical protein